MVYKNDKCLPIKISGICHKTKRNWQGLALILVLQEGEG